MDWCCHDEMNLAEFPLAVLGDRVPAGVKTLTFEDAIMDRGRSITRRLTVSGSDKYGLPTSLDDEVILGLIQVTKENQFRDRLVQFSRYRLIKLLDWRDEGKSYRRLEESLRRWMGVTLYYDNAWWDRQCKQWVDESFHILDHLTIHRGDSRGVQRTNSSFQWNELVFRSFQAGYVKPVNMSLYSQIVTPTAKRIFRFLDKRFHRASNFRMDLRRFAEEHIGVRRCYDLAQLKRRVRPAILELQKLGFLFETGEWIVPVRRGSCDIVVFKGPAAFCKRRNKRKLDPQSRILVDRGVSRTMAIKLAREFSAEQIRDSVAAFDKLVQSCDRRISKNPPGFLVSAIRQQYTFPMTPKRTAPSRPRQQIETPECIMDSLRDENDTAFERHVSGLSGAEQASFERDAFQAASRFDLTAYRRAIEADSKKRIDGCRRAILLSFFKATRKINSSSTDENTCAA